MVSTQCSREYRINQTSAACRASHSPRHATCGLPYVFFVVVVFVVVVVVVVFVVFVVFVVVVVVVVFVFVVVVVAAVVVVLVVVAAVIVGVDCRRWSAWLSLLRHVDGKLVCC